MPKQDTAQVLLGFDFGLKRIGVAVGQTLTKTATPLATLAAKKGIPDWQQVAKLIAEWQPNALVIGLPLNMDGTSQKLTELAQNFAKQLSAHFNLPVYEMDERLSTIAAREKIFNAGGYRALQKQEIDSIAAQLIVESWMTRKLPS